MSVRYIHQIAIAFDQILNTIAGGFADETLSARMYRNALRDSLNNEKTIWWYLEKIINWIFIPQDWLVKKQGLWTGARHCERAYLSEIKRMHYPNQYRNNIND